MNDELSERQAADDETLPEYDFSGGVRGKHYQAYQRGYQARQTLSGVPARLSGHHPQGGWDN
jgi:hypothetical protein